MIRTIIAFVAAIVFISIADDVRAQDITTIHDRVNSADDYEAVRKVIRKEIQGWFKNDSEQVYSVFDADNFVGIWASGSNDPKEWVVGASGQADVRAYADGARIESDLPEGYQHNAEIQHVHIKGNHALAVARQWTHIPDEANNREIDGQFETVWILKKSGEGWKIISYIGQVTSKRVITEN